ncbi:hypothetical protein A2363_01040 [Candidatus Gottesmanbacteria bacterium RIFOXYB1_FULL_47_11]|uniref:Uncharacterized protein n=1 Tax=Candidatus Gottesmanbacteria bacterium RIFOXYB1_FULL_47_11 TaxID=1798401 RepID=A0A1F6BGL4_9BACT|nr:MAG: hypothetical protein A2363_01040 [Candidatus Gottesmanbacteria bacterium RIFOXYB1_FULL_47_11]
MIRRSPEAPAVDRKQEVVPTGIDILVVAPAQLILSSRKSAFSRVEELLQAKITEKAVMSYEAWSEDQSKAGTHDGAIIICDNLSETVGRLQNASNKPTMPMLIIALRINETEVKSLSHLLWRQADDQESGLTVYDIVTSGELRTYPIGRFIACAAQRKLVPGGSSGI